MKRYSIRDNRSAKPIKTRVCDVVVSDDGEMQLEVAGKKGIVSITLKDLENQIKDIKQKQK